MSINQTELKEKLQSNRTGPTRRSIVIDLIFVELPKRKCFGGDVHGTYADFRAEVLRQATSQTVLEMKPSVAALNFNNVRNEMNDIVEALGGIEINGKVYKSVKMERDPATKKATGPRIPEGQWFVVNKASARVAEGVKLKKSAQSICNNDTQVVVSRKEYIQNWLGKSKKKNG